MNQKSSNATTEGKKQYKIIIMCWMSAVHSEMNWSNCLLVQSADSNQLFLHAGDFRSWKEEFRSFLIIQVSFHRSYNTKEFQKKKSLIFAFIFDANSTISNKKYSIWINIYVTNNICIIPSYVRSRINGFFKLFQWCFNVS